MPPIHNHFILLVEDEADIVLVFSRAFKDQEGFMLDIAMNVDLAIQKVKVVTYDLIFLDMKIGEKYAGMEVLRELHRQKVRGRVRQQLLHDSHVVIMSNSIPLQDVMREAHSLGVFSFIDKPMPFTVEFIEQVVQHFGISMLPSKTWNGIA